MNRLKDVTFVIPLRIDSPERARNLDVLLDFILRHFDSTILVMEADSRRQYAVKHANIQYFFKEDQNPIFHRTMILNLLYQKVDTQMIAVWDTDVLAPPEQIVETTAQIHNGNAVIGLPYNGYMYQTTAEMARLYQETSNFAIFTQGADRLRTMYGDLSTGGAVIVDTEKYMQAGGENEFFLGWGPEDAERVKRMEILYPQPVYRAKGGLFHLWHPRYLNSWYANRDLEINEKEEFLKVCSMNARELENYIKSWPWLERLLKK